MTWTILVSRLLEFFQSPMFLIMMMKKSMRRCISTNTAPKVLVKAPKIRRSRILERIDQGRVSVAVRYLDLMKNSTQSKRELTDVGLYTLWLENIVYFNHYNNKKQPLSISHSNHGEYRLERIDDLMQIVRKEGKLRIPYGWNPRQAGEWEHRFFMHVNKHQKQKCKRCSNIINVDTIVVGRNGLTTRVRTHYFHPSCILKPLQDAEKSLIIRSQEFEETRLKYIQDRVESRERRARAEALKTKDSKIPSSLIHEIDVEAERILDGDYHHHDNSKPTIPSLNHLKEIMGNLNYGRYLDEHALQSLQKWRETQQSLSLSKKQKLSSSLSSERLPPLKPMNIEEYLGKRVLNMLTNVPSSIVGDHRTSSSTTNDDDNNNNVNEKKSFVPFSMSNEARKIADKDALEVEQVLKRYVTLDYSRWKSECETAFASIHDILKTGKLRGKHI